MAAKKNMQYGAAENMSEVPKKTDFGSEDSVEATYYRKRSQMGPPSHTSRTGGLSATMGVVPAARTRRCWTMWQGGREWLWRHLTSSNMIIFTTCKGNNV